MGVGEGVVVADEVAGRDGVEGDGVDRSEAPEHPASVNEATRAALPSRARLAMVARARAQRQRVDMKKPTQMMPKPMPRFQYWLVVSPSGIGYFELET